MALHIKAESPCFNEPMSYGELNFSSRSQLEKPTEPGMHCMPIRMYKYCRYNEEEVALV